MSVRPQQRPTRRERQAIQREAARRQGAGRWGIVLLASADELEAIAAHLEPLEPAAGAEVHELARLAWGIAAELMRLLD
jgi:hypothetical protein